MSGMPKGYTMGGGWGGFFVQAFLALCLALWLLLSLARAQTDPPHWIRQAVLERGALLVSWSEWGGTDKIAVYRVATQASATWRCLLPDQTCPPTRNLQELTEVLEAEATITVTAATGWLTGKAILLPPSPPEEDCPEGQAWWLLSNSFAAITLTNLSTGRKVPVRPAALSATQLTCQ